MKKSLLFCTIALLVGSIVSVGCKDSKTDGSETGSSVASKGSAGDAAGADSKGTEKGDPATKAGDTATSTSGTKPKSATSTMIELNKKIKSTPDEAVKELNAKKSENPANGVTSYMTALAYAEKKEWSKVLDEVKAGNAAEKRFLDVKEPDVNEVIPGFSQMASLATTVKKNAESIKPAELKPLLAELDQMAVKLMSTEPQSLIGLLQGMAMKRTIIMTKIDVAKKAGDKAAQTAADAEMKSLDKWVKDIMPAITENKKAENDVYKKHGFDFKELSKPGAMAKLKPEEKAKLDQVWLDIMEVNRKVVEAALKLQPK